VTLVRFDDVSLEFGDQVILDHAGFAIESGERVCLIGRNGAGKTSLLRLITGQIEPDHGEIEFRSDVVVSQLEQALPDEQNLSVREYVTGGLASLQELVNAYQGLSKQDLDTQGLREMQELQQRIDSLDGWRIDQRVDIMLTELDLPAERQLAELSGGWQRRVGLARALVSQPDLLLLDEPTNHLDLATITWLEDRVYAYPGSVLFVTHDRAFLQRLATRILELDRARLISWPGDYRNYLQRKDQTLEAEARQHAEFDKKLAEEEAWIRQGIKARRHRNEGRVRSLMAMRETRAQRLAKPDQARINIEQAERSGRKVIRAKNVSYSFGAEPLIQGFSMRIMRGDRIGLVGNNGVGKSTLLRVLLGQLQPQQGTVKHGTHLEIGYFDQMRRKLDPDKSVAENVGEGRDYIRVNGKDRHVVGYLRGFLFSAKRAMTPVKALSGGERNRVILAKLFTRPTNLLVLDEPTNDLDIETLEVLEDRLVEYDGSLIVVSHDREFLDNVVTSILAFEEDGQIKEYVGSYSDWLRRGHHLAEVDNPNAPSPRRQQTSETRTRRQPTKLSYKQQRELNELPTLIESLEQSIGDLQAQVNAQGFYAQPHETVQAILDELTRQNVEIEQCVERWTELEELQQQFEKARSGAG
jgi:ATP-binding cassette subfamily F protein uup